MDNLTNSEYCFLSDLSRQECHRYTTVNQVSKLKLLGQVTYETDVCLRKQLSLFLSSHELNTRIRTFRARGRFRQHLYFSEYTEEFNRPEFSRTRTSTTTQSTRYDLHTAHVRGEIKNTNLVLFKYAERSARTSHCVREGNQATSHCSECADQTERSIRKVRRARTQTCSWQSFTKRGRCDTPLVTQHQGG